MSSGQTNHLAVIKRVITEWRKGTLSIGLNFHRVGASMPSDPFRYLDTISQEAFRNTLLVLRLVFEVVRLPDVVEKPRKSPRPRLVLTFDDVSRTFLSHALPVLEKYDLPVTLFPCVRITDTGSGWRDLVYDLSDAPDLQPGINQRVEKVLGKAAVQQLQTHGLYKWSKSLDHKTAWLEREILLPVLGERYERFKELVSRHQPYLNWNDLKELAKNPLVTIGSHGFLHYDYRGLTNEEIRRDVSDAQELFFRNLGSYPQHLALPFGALDQRVWQTLDAALPALGIKTASWCSSHGNAVRLGHSRVLHLSRLNARASTRRTIKDCVKALSRPLASLIQAFPNSRLPGEGRFDTNVSEDEYRHIHLLILPDKRRHQLPEYYAYQFKDNPYRNPASPVHFGLHHDDNLEAILSLLWVQFAVRGQPIKGAYGSGWWRLPQIHSLVGTKPFLAMARAVSPLLGAYKASQDSGRLFARDGWTLVRVTRYEGRLTKTTGKSSYRVADSYPGEIDALLASANASASFSIWRDRRYYAWRFEQYPLAKYFYLFDSNPARTWFAMVASDGKRLHLSDVIARPLNDATAWQEMFSAISHYLQTIGVGQVVVETNNPSLMRVSEASGLKIKSTFNNFYCLSPEIQAQAGGPLIERGLHETQATGDVLPGRRDPG